MLLQRTLIFRSRRLPREHVFQSDYPLKEYFFDFSIDREAYSINTVHLLAENSKGMVFFLHGTLHHIQYHLPKANIFLENNYDVVIMDYPRYGKSKGKLTEDLLHRVVEVTYRKTMEQLQHMGKVVLVGRSLGTALASNLATKVQPDKLVLISPYFNMPDLFHHKVRLLPFKRLKFKLENNRYLPQVACDAYIIHGNEDKLIPIALSKKLMPFLKSEEHFVEIPDANHFNVHEKEAYKKLMREILQ